MHIPKKYGQSKTHYCPLCKKIATSMNPQKIPVCIGHKETTLENLKCVCGEYLDSREGKYGVFFTCISCGAMNLNKVLEINNPLKPENISTEFSKETKTAKFTSTNQFANKSAAAKNSKPKEITIRSDDPRYFD